MRERTRERNNSEKVSRTGIIIIKDQLTNQLLSFDHFCPLVFVVVSVSDECMFTFRGYIYGRMVARALSRYPLTDANAHQSALVSRMAHTSSQG